MKMNRLIGKVEAFNKEIVGYAFIPEVQDKDEFLNVAIEALNLEQSFRLIGSGQCSNAEIIQGKVECKDSSIDALMTFNTIGQRADCKVVIISVLKKGNTRIGFDILLQDSRIVTLRYEQAVYTVEKCGATNAKVLNKENGKILSATKGTFKERIIGIAKNEVTSNDIVITNTLMFSNNGVARMGKHGLETMGILVGYRIMNTGKYPLEYKTAYYHKSDNNNLFSIEERTLQLYPGQHADIARKYFAIMGLSDQFVLKFGNGKLIRGLARVKSGDIDAELNAYYFSFDNKDISAYDPAIVLQIGKEIQSNNQPKWVVKPEFEMTFGFLSNPRVRRNKR